MIYYGGKEVTTGYVVKGMLMSALSRDNDNNSNNDNKKKVNKKRIKAGDKKC